MLVKMITTVAVLALVFIYRCCGTDLKFSSYAPPTAKLDFQVDLALLMQAMEFSVFRHWFLTLVDYLEVAEDKIHIGAWFVSEFENETIVDLTGNASHFIEMLKDYKPPQGWYRYSHWGSMFSQMVDVFKDTGRRGIPKLMYAGIIDRLSVPTSNYAIEAEKAGLQLHAGFCFYDDYRPDNFRDFLLQHFPAARHNNRFVHDDLSDLLCGQENETCTFNTSDACITYGGSLIPVDPLECSKFPNLTKKSCDKAKCEKFCNDHDLQWPNMTEACAGKCGKITIQRNQTSGNLPQWELKMVSRCPVEAKEVHCPACTTTQTSTSSSTQQKTVQKTSASPSASSPKPVSTTSVQDNLKSTPKSSSDTFPLWAIIVIVAAVAIALLGIILAVVISRRRRAQKKPAPASEEMAATVPTPKAKVVVKSGRGVGVAVGGESGAAVKSEESVGVSLKEDVTTKSQKAAGSSIKTSIKGEAEMSEKGSEKSSRVVPKVAKGSKVATMPKKA